MICKFLKELFSSERVAIYRIYGHKWKVVLLDDGWDIEKDEWFPTLFVSDKYESLFWLRLDMPSKDDDGFNYSFYVENNRDIEMDKVWV